MTGYLAFQMLGLPVTPSKTSKRDANSFCNSLSPSTSTSDAEKCVVNHAVARSVSAVH
jgi:hypothetical protein